MRTLQPPPAAVVDRQGGCATGSYEGALPRVDLTPLGRSWAYRAGHLKKWFYTAVAGRDVFAAVAVVDLGYASKAFAFACADGRMLADRTSLGPPRAASVSDATGSGAFARYRGLRSRVAIEQRGDVFEVDARLGDLDLQWSMTGGEAPPPIAAISKLPGGGLNATEKKVLLHATGRVRTGGASRTLEGAFGGYDYTHGYLARHTLWRWAFLMGRAACGTPVSMNLVQGFVGEGECALWVGDRLFPVGEGRVELDPKRPSAPWRVTTTCGAVDLAFSPWGVHAEDSNFGIVRARFVQPAGAYRGTVRAEGRELRLDGVLGVAEDQDVLW